jgi:hypothetical protein
MITGRTVLVSGVQRVNEGLVLSCWEHHGVGGEVPVRVVQINVVPHGCS